jgi:hypothetical protein
MRTENTMTRLRAQARAHVSVISKAYEAFFPHAPVDAEGTPRTVLELFLSRYPMRAATRGQAAIHEAGHFVLFERLGLCATTAEIRGSAGGLYGWGGGAHSWNWLTYRGPEQWDAAALRREAVTVLAGPIAEELLGGGDALGSNIGELVEAVVLALRAADLEGHEARSEVVQEILHGTISLVEHHEPEILGIGGVSSGLSPATRSEAWGSPPTRRNIHRGSAIPTG